MTTTTGTATRTGTMARYRSMPDPEPPAGTPWSCRTTRPATDAAIAVTSATGRRQRRAEPAVPVDRVSAVVMRAGLAGGDGLRCCHAAMTGGPASAARMAIAASGQPAQAPPPGTTETARPAPINRPRRTATPAPCNSAPPRARRTVSSPWRRATSIRAASRITATPTTTRLTNRSRSTVSTAGWVLQKGRADRQRFRGGRERAGQRGRDRGGVVQRVVQALHLVRVHAADGERELELQREAGAAESSLERAELVRVRDDPAGPEERRCGRGLLERRPHQVRVLLPAGRSGVAFSHDAGHEQCDWAGRGGQ